MAALYQAGISGNAACNIPAGTYPFGVLTETQINCLGIPTAAGAAGRVLFDLNPDYKNNYTIQANLGIQRQITNNLSIEVAYQMYHGLHIQQPVGLNYCEAGHAGLSGDRRQPDRDVAARRAPGPALSSMWRGHHLRADQRRGHHAVHRLPVAGQFDLSRDDRLASRGASAITSPSRPTTPSARRLTIRRISIRLLRRLSRRGSSRSGRCQRSTSGTTSSSAASSKARSRAGRCATSRSVRASSSAAAFPSRCGLALTPMVTLAAAPIASSTSAATPGSGRTTAASILRLSKSFRFKQDGPMRFESDSRRRESVQSHELRRRQRDHTGLGRSYREYSPSPRRFRRRITTAGTVRLTGRRDRDFTKGDPLSFTSAFNPRQILFGLKFVF